MTKNNFYFLGIIACLVFILAVVTTTTKSKSLSLRDSDHDKSEESNNNISQVDDIPGTASDLSNREIAIKAAETSPHSLPKTRIGNDVYLLTGYEDTFYGQSDKDNKPGRKFGGILVFKMIDGEPELFWESDEYITQKYMSFKDIDSDGVQEIVWEGDLGATGRNSSIYVYRFNSNTFYLITPVEYREGVVSGIAIRYGWTLISGLPELTYIKDVDNDGMMEITTGYYDENGKFLKQVYKFDGSEYHAMEAANNL